LFIYIPFHEKNRDERLIRQETDFRKNRFRNQAVKAIKTLEIRAFLQKSRAQGPAFDVAMQ
jgi:hypothetical protein